MALLLNQVSKITQLPYGGVRLWCIKAVERDKWQSFENHGEKIKTVEQEKKMVWYETYMRIKMRVLLFFNMFFYNIISIVC